MSLEYSYGPDYWDVVKDKLGDAKVGGQHQPTKQKIGTPLLFSFAPLWLRAAPVQRAAPCSAACLAQLHSGDSRLQRPQLAALTPTGGGQAGEEAKEGDSKEARSRVHCGAAAAGLGGDAAAASSSPAGACHAACRVHAGWARAVAGHVGSPLCILVAGVFSWGGACTMVPVGVQLFRPTLRMLCRPKASSPGTAAAACPYPAPWRPGASQATAPRRARRPAVAAAAALRLTGSHREC